MSNVLKKGDSTEAEFCKRIGRIRIAETNSTIRIESLDWIGDPDPVSEESNFSKFWLISNGGCNFLNLPPLSILVQVTISSLNYYSR